MASDDLGACVERLLGRSWDDSLRAQEGLFQNFLKEFRRSGDPSVEAEEEGDVDSGGKQAKRRCLEKAGGEIKAGAARGGPCAHDGAAGGDVEMGEAVAPEGCGFQPGSRAADSCPEAEGGGDGDGGEGRGAGGSLAESPEVGGENADSTFRGAAPANPSTVDEDRGRLGPEFVPLPPDGGRPDGMPSDGQDGRANDGPYDPKIDEGEGRPLGRGEDPQVRRADDDASCSISFGSSPKATGQTSGRESILAASSPQPPSSVGPGWATRTSLLYGDLPESDGTGSHAPPPPQASAEQAPPAAGAAPPVVTHPASEGVGTTQPPQTPVEPGPVFAPADCASTVTPAFLVTSSRLNWVPESVGQPGSGGSEIGRPKEGEGANRDRKPLALNLSQEPGKVCGSSGGQTASQGGRTDDSAAFCTPCSQSDQPTPAMVVYSVRRSKPTEYQITPYRSDSDSEELSKGRKPIPDWCTDQDVLEEEAKAQNKTEKAKLTKLFGAGKMFCNLQELFGREPLTSHNPAKRF